MAASLIAATMLGPVPAISAEPPEAAAARHLAATLGGSPTDYSLAYQRPLTSGGAGTLAFGGTWAGKFVNPPTGAVETVYVTSDGQGGGSELLAARHAAELASLSPLMLKADDGLQGAVEAAASGPVPVAIWVEADDAVAAAEQAVRDRHPEVGWLGERPLPSTAEVARAIRAELWEARRAAYDTARAAVVAEVARLGGTVAYESTSTPLLFADMPASAVPPLAARTDVLSLGLERTSRETMSSAGPTVEADWTTGGADQGGGARVAVVEYHNVHNTGDLAGKVVDSHGTTGSLAYAYGEANHPTWVAGAVASLNASYPGVAPGANIVSSSTGGYTPSLATDRAIVAAADWAVAPNGGDADIVNTSIGQDTATGAEEARRYFDSVGWEDGRVLVSSAGNFSTFGHWDILSPGTGWNVVTVGGIDDRGSAGSADDAVWYVPGSDGSSYHDPPGTAWNPHGDFNKPNLSAPAVSVRTANGMIGSGTSVASPIVAGIAAQLVARDPTLLAWPEAVRALLMAGAVSHTLMPDGSVNADHEGAGSASAAWANRALEGGGYGGYAVGAMNASQTPTRQISVAAGQRVRVVLAWSSHTSGSNNLSKVDALASDLDLAVTGPDGMVARSLSFDNNYEIVEIVAGASGTVTMQVLHDRFETSSEPYALAWVLPPPFSDIAGTMFEADILWAYGQAITAGCAATLFCPDGVVTREQMASFLVRALDLPATSNDYFTDDGGSIHQSDINRLAAVGIAAGCGGGRYCPGAVVSRQEMASFLVRALHLPATGTDYFTDDAGSIHQPDINSLAASGITGGCGGSQYCPHGSVTRGQMVAFLHRALGG